MLWSACAFSFALSPPRRAIRLLLLSPLHCDNSPHASASKTTSGATPCRISGCSAARLFNRFLAYPLLLSAREREQAGNGCSATTVTRTMFSCTVDHFRGGRATRRELPSWGTWRRVEGSVAGPCGARRGPRARPLPRPQPDVARRTQYNLTAKPVLSHRGQPAAFSSMTSTPISRSRTLSRGCWDFSPSSGLWRGSPASQVYSFLSVCACESLYSGWPHREPQADAGFVRVTLAGWKDTAQAIVAFLNVEHSKQAMGRLQNFPIWGRPLRLAYSVEEGMIGRGDTSPSRKLDMERPATAPQQRAAPGNLTSPSGHVREAGARRRIWDVPTDPSPLARKAPADSDYGRNESLCTVLSFLLCLGCAAPCRLHFLV